MTDTINSVAIAAEIKSMRHDLATVTAAAPIMGKPAIETAARLEKAIALAEGKLADALANDLLEAQKKRLSAFSDIRVDYDRTNTSLINTAFTIKYTKASWDMALGQTVPREHTSSSFAALPNDAYEYLVTMRPAAIPAPIMALAPNDPHEAFSIYLAGKARGYFKGRVAA